MKKKLLFVIPSLDAGGAEKSLVNLLNSIDEERFSVDLFLFAKKGLFLNQVPSFVKILSPNQDLEMFQKPLLASVVDFIKKGRLKLAFDRIVFAVIQKLEKNKAVAEQKSWKYLRNSILNLPENYDTSISYLEKTSLYFNSEKTQAKKKIAWIHTDYQKSGLNPKVDTVFFEKQNLVVTISDECKNSLLKNFGNIKVEVFPNISSPKLILNLSDEPLDFKEKIDFLTIARLSHEKGIDLAIETAKILKQKNSSFLWAIIGEGNERENLENLIQKYQLQDNFKLLGLKENPYPYLKNCGIYVQPSRYEGKSIAIDEAIILQKPIVITNFSTSKDQISDGETGLIAEMNPESLANKILELQHNQDLKNKLVDNLKQKTFGNEYYIEKLYSILS